MTLVQQYWPLAAGVAAVISMVWVGLVTLRDSPPPFEKKGVLLNPAEIAFLRALEAAVRGDWQIFSMIRLSDLIKVRAKTRKSQTWQKSVANKHVDFVLCDVETFEVKVVIELDEEGARFPDRVARERFLNNALYSAGLPLVRIRVETKYETAALRKSIEDALGIVKKKKKW